MVFTALPNIKAGQAFYADVKGRMEKAGRIREHMKIMPACFVMRRRDHGGGAARSAPCSTAWSTTPTPSPRCRSRSATTPRNSIRTAPLPDESRRATPAKSGRERAIALAQAREPDRAPARAAARRLWRARHGRHAQDDRRRDGGMARDAKPPTASPSSSPICPAGSTISSTRSCRSCSAAACSAREYEGTTLRENLGLPRPENRFFEKVRERETAPG